MNSIPFSIIITSIIFVGLPTLIAIGLRWFCYQYLKMLNNDLTRLLMRVDRTVLSERLNGVMQHLHQRYREVSLKTDRVNTIALVEVFYAEQYLRWPFGRISLERIDSYTRTLPNLLLSFGLIGTFFGITTNLISLGSIVNTTQASNISDLVQALQSPLEGMGIAFYSSLFALIASASNITINLCWNINTEKDKLINGFENYLDNIYQVNLNGDSKLDKTIDRMAKTFDNFLIDFGDSLKKSVESALQDKIQEISNAYIKVADLAAQSYSRFDDTSSNIAKSADRFQSSSLILHQAVKEIHDSQFAQSLAKTTAALKATLCEFEISSQRLSTSVVTLDKSLTESTSYLSESIHELVDTQDNFAVSIHTLHETIGDITKGAEEFQSAALILHQSTESINNSDFAQSLSIAANALKNTVTEFHTSSNHLAETIDSIQDFIGEANSQFSHSMNDLSVIQNSFAESSKHLNATVSSLHYGLENVFLDKIETISTSYIGIASLAGQAYDRLNHISDTIAQSTNDLKDSSVIFQKSAQSFENADFAQSFQTFSRSIDAMQNCIDSSTGLLSKSISSLSQVQSGFEHSSTKLDQTVSILQHSLDSLITNGIHEISTSYSGIANLATQVYEKLDHVFETIDHSTSNIQSSALVFQQTIQALENNQFAQSLQESTQALTESTLQLQTSSIAFHESAHVLEEQKFTELLVSSMTELRNLHNSFQLTSDGLQETIGVISHSVHTLDSTGQQSLATLEKISNLNDLQQVQQQHLNDIIPQITHVFQEISGRFAQNDASLNNYIEAKSQLSQGIEHQLGEAIIQLCNISKKIEYIETFSTNNFRDLQETVNTPKKRSLFIFNK